MPAKRKRCRAIALQIQILLSILNSQCWTADLRGADEPIWGDEQNGLICRLVPVNSDMDDEAIDLDRKDSRFTSCDRMAFAIEIKNVSSAPVILLGVRYGDGYGAAKGKLKPNHYAPHLFEFRFADSGGQPIARTRRHFEPDTQFMIVSGALSHELAPSESIKFLLRPARFDRSMDYQLGPGLYTAQVVYRGPSEPVRDRIAKHFPDNPAATAWHHEVVSNQVEFSISPQESAPSVPLVWGPETDGLQAALEIRPPRDLAANPQLSPGVPIGTPLQAVFHVKNVSDRPITFVSESPRQGDRIEVTDARGEPYEVQDVWMSGWPIDVRWHLEPGETAELTVLTPSLNQIKEPGQYIVRYTIRFNSRIKKDAEGNVVFPAAGDWQAELETSAVPLVLSPRSE